MARKCPECNGTGYEFDEDGLGQCTCCYGLGVIED